jgi:ABC-type lipopolysaccharide export system ATPase subunit
MIRKQSAKKGIILTDHDYNNVLDVANKYMILFDGGIKILKTREEYIYWGYLPENRRP